MEHTHHYFMYDEIYDEPHLLRRLILDRHNEEFTRIARLIKEVAVSGGDIFLVGSGSSFNSCIFARNLFSLKNHLLINAFSADEFLNYVTSVDRKSLIIFVSQSGETADEIEAFNHIKHIDAMTIAITNDTDSTLANTCKEILPLNAGNEVAVPATKSYLAEITQFILISEEISGEYELESKQEIVVPEMKRILGSEYQLKIRSAAKKLANVKNIFVLGFGIDLANASETALKIKECANIETEAFPLHEFMHGPVSLVNDKSAMIIFEPESESNLETLKRVIDTAKSAGAYSILVGGRENRGADIHFETESPGVLSVIPEIIPMQLISYYLAIYRSLNPDKPTGLTKVVE